MVSKEQILKKGSVEVHVKVGGIRQRHTLKVEREKTAWGFVPFLVFSRQVPAAELIRIAEELQLPVKCKGMKVFPKGKAAQDFAEKDPVKRKGLAHDRVLSSRSAVSGSEDEEEENDESEGEETGEEEDEEESEGIEEEQKTEGETDEESEEVADPEESEGEEHAPEPEGSGDEQKEETEEEPKEQSIEFEDTSPQKQKAPDDSEKNEEKPRKKIFGGVLSEGILT